MMTSQILKFVDSPKTQKTKYFGEKIFFLHIFIHSLFIKGYNFPKNGFLAEVTFNEMGKLFYSWLQNTNI